MNTEIVKETKNELEVKTELEVENKRLCTHCGKELEELINKSGKNYNSEKFCSITCSRRYSARIKTEKLINSLEVRYCPNCSKELKPEKDESYSAFKVRTFCNQSCSAIYNNSRRIKNKYFCTFCGEELDKKGKYCNGTCQANHNFDIYINKWKKGKVNGLSGSYAISRHIRRYLFEKYDSKCCKCGWGEVNPYTNKKPLEIEHKDGNYKNNNEENLELLCPNCHSLTETYKGANKGNGRKSRKKYSLYENEE